MASSSIRVAPTTTGVDVLGALSGAGAPATVAGFAGIDGVGPEGAGADSTGAGDCGAGVTVAAGFAEEFTDSEADVTSGKLLAGRLGQSSMPINTAARISPAEIAVGDRHQGSASVSVNSGASSSGVRLFVGGAEATGPPPMAEDD